jgi:RNA polymerase sigma-70 factor (ECF subfamily)
VARAIALNRSAFAELYERYVERVYRYILFRTGNPTDSEDILGNVFLKAWRNIGHFRLQGETSFSAWLFTLARNEVTDRHRRPRDLVSLDLAGDVMASAALSGNPEAVLEWRLTVEELCRALSLLTDEQREVVLLRFVEGLSAREVGAIMHKREGTVRGMQFRAIEALRRAITEKQEDHGHAG